VVEMHALISLSNCKVYTIKTEIHRVQIQQETDQNLYSVRHNVLKFLNGTVMTVLMLGMVIFAVFVSITEAIQVGELLYSLCVYADGCLTSLVCLLYNA
jgi:hypothetical protein